MQVTYDAYPGAHIRGGGGGGGGVTPPPQLFKIARKSVPKNAYQITSSVPEHPIYQVDIFI
jgi:hypothetical protein